MRRKLRLRRNSGGNSGTETEFLKYKKFGLRPRITAAYSWLQPSAAPRLFRLNLISSIHPLVRASSGVLNVLSIASFSKPPNTT